MKIKSFEQIKKMREARVLVRVDFNTPIIKGKVADDFKIKACLPLLDKLVKEKAKIILITHLGEPVLTKAGKVKATDKKKFSVAPIARHLAKLMRSRKVKFLSQTIGGQGLTKQLNNMAGGEIVVLENIRFYAGEKKNDKKFAKELAGLADFYINNAFASSHRDHASVSAVKKYLPSFAGPLLATEIAKLNKVLRPKRPLLAIIGGVKIDTKIGLVKVLSKKAEHVFIGGALANNFLAARGHDVGRSLVTREGIKIAKKLMKKNILLPVDVVVQDQKTKQITVKNVRKIGKNDMILDIGPETMKQLGKLIRVAETIIWNGPMGKFEEPRFRFGTMFVARAVASRAGGKAFAVVGGGETVEAVNLSGSAEQIDWISTGGGASLAYLAGEKMPGLG